MFNLNIPASSLLGVEGNGGLCSKPNTPEILNSLIAMTNPLDNYNFNGNNSSASTPASVTMRNFIANTQNISQDSCHSSSSSTPLDSPAATNFTPSVQQTCSQLIKAGLKLSIQSKRKLSTCDSSSGSEQPLSKCSRPNDDYDDTTDDDSELKTTIPNKGLTPEDEDRRRRRRERNKIAATKCRMKKRERTQNLIKEAEQLDHQNVDLKNQVRLMEIERRKLLDMLQAHEPSCVHQEGLCLPSKLLQSPAFKYLADLNLDDCVTVTTTNGTASSSVSIASSSNSQQPTPTRTVIPPMSTIKFSRSNGFKAAAAAAALTNPVSIVSQLPSLTQNSPLHHQATQLPNGYCKPSPTHQDLSYLNSPSQDSNMCIAGLQTQTHLTTTSTPTAHQNALSSSASSLVTGHTLADYIPNCDSGLGLSLAHTSTTCRTPISSNGGDSSALLASVASVASPLSCVSTPTTATEFVKNELVDSQSPYTTAQSAERFLFENNCDSFVDIKHAVNVHQSVNQNHGGPTLLQNTNGSSNLLDFTTTLMGGNGSGIVSFHDQISIKNDYLHEADLLAQLTGEAADFVDLDTGVAAAFMANGGCLA
ncbi:activating transcription factor 3 [Stomoxys calcitrans]|uniref:BZIP domain-containing protein n=1 Tax=Stomoxys calcitrans TaxID=35570 RepID=A0A1I8Q3S9_STOCA|nr:activating transcription factor 3 [Stomoxys calcitrans]